MLERLLIAILLALVAWAAYTLFHSGLRRRLTAAGPQTGGAQFSGPRLLYFRGDHCGSCSTQAHYLEQVAQRGEVVIQQVDVEREPETAAAYGVFTLPTTMILDSQGQVQHINYGLADSYKLGRQLENLK